MKLQIAWIGKTKEPAIQALSAEYLKRISRYVQTDSHELAAEPALLKLADRASGRTAPVLILLDIPELMIIMSELHVLCTDTQQPNRGPREVF